MIWREWISIKAYSGSEKIEAFIIGDYALHRTVGCPSVTTITHLKSGKSIGEWTSMRVAFRFACFVNGTFSEDEVAQDGEVIRLLRFKRLHVTFVPRYDDLEWIEEHAPHWFETRHSDLVIQD